MSAFHQETSFKHLTCILLYFKSILCLCFRIQVAVNSKILARGDVRALKKDVTAKCYGGDMTRKMKLLKRQAEGKKHMRTIGNVEISKDTFVQIVKKR